MMKSTEVFEDIIRGYGAVVVGFSGGVDSTVVGVTALRILGSHHVLAVLGISPSLGDRQRSQAVDLAQQFQLPLHMIETAEFADQRYVENTPNRCFFCKSHLWEAVAAVARQRGIDRIVDGTNADDVRGHRPGRVAARAAQVHSPLLDAGMSKDDVRQLAKRRGIPIWDAPAAPCLASRVTYGLSVTTTRLTQVERAEDVLREVGVVGDLRVRHCDQEARIEVLPNQFDLVRDHGELIARSLRDVGFGRVTLDLGGYGSGRLLDAEPRPVEMLG